MLKHTLATGIEPSFHVITIDLSPAKDECVVHFVFLDGTQHVVTFQQLHRF